MALIFIILMDKVLSHLPTVKFTLPASMYLVFSLCAGPHFTTGYTQK